jgi:hypothetical protein
MCTSLTGDSNRDDNEEVDIQELQMRSVAVN